MPTKRDNRYSKYIDNIESQYSEWHLTGLREALAKSEGISVRELSKKYSKESLEKRLEEFVLAAPDQVVRTARVAPEDITELCRVQLKASQETRGVIFKAPREGKQDMYFLNGEQLIFYSSKAKYVDGHWITGEAGSTIWDDILSNNLHNEGQVTFPNGKKPEALIKRLLDMGTQKGDYVLDSFAGSGTTGAAAHKMGRRWIVVELGDHCHTHIIPRLKRVVNAEDPSGITGAVGWKGGGGFRYYRLAPSLLEKDQFGNWVINKKYNPAMLAEAICKLEGFTYAPSDTTYWQHGHSTENDFIYVTTQTLTREQFQRLSDEVGEGRSLLVMCGAFRVKNLDDFPNLTVKKIPKAVMNRCEWGKDDYSLEIKNLPFRPVEETDEETTKQENRLVKGERSKQTSLFNFDGKGNSK